MKKYWLVLLLITLLVSCSDKNDKEVATAPVKSKKISLIKTPSIDYADKKFSFSQEKIVSGCDEDSEIICAINRTIKCTIDPKFSECDKALMPKFIFMEDESLNRPTEMSYQITKLKPLSGGQMEVYTQSQCNGTWFGLCSGNIIYVMSQENNQWIVKDIYARTATIDNAQ